jgi:predicted nuclease of predicted toxin-antitoxin system
MRILFDECMPKRLKRSFPHHQIRTVAEMGWSGKKNGALLQLMTQNGFEVLLTVDKNLRHQQNLQAAGVAVVIMVAGSISVPDLLPLVPNVEQALTTIQPGDVVEVR